MKEVGLVCCYLVFVMPLFIVIVYGHNIEFASHRVFIHYFLITDEIDALLRNGNKPFTILHERLAQLDMR